MFYFYTLWKSKGFLTFSRGKAILGQCFISIPPENFRKQKVFWRFQGVWKGNIELKWINDAFIINLKHIQKII